MSEAPLLSIGHDILSVFDTSEHSYDFLIEVIEASIQSDEVERLLRQSMLAGAEDWMYLIECAKSIRQDRGIDYASLDGQDVLSYIWYIFDPVGVHTSSQPWEETDRLIAQAKRLGQDAEIYLPSPAVELDTIEPTSRQSTAQTHGHFATSHYWSGQQETQDTSQSYRLANQTLYRQDFSQNLQYQGYPVFTTPSNFPGIDAPEPYHFLHEPGFAPATTFQDDQFNGTLGLPFSNFNGVAVGAKQATTSPYFAPPTPPTESISPRKRPPPGTVSTVPFATLDSPFFGVIQEEFAHDPFWLLIAVTFLIRTNGKLAIPMFYKVKERFPTPGDIADPENTEPLVEMIQHLGLSIVRVAFMQKYARGFLEQTPRMGVRFKVKNYDKRDIDPSLRGTHEDLADELDAWEIGHLTKGKYSIDSWRIFCRDELLGRAQDWNGKGREPEFQPEWMRVMPEDKELRAYLRWMWMREGWEWDPITGQRTVLRDELRRAVNERRVEYDDTGGLRILNEPRPADP